MENVAFVKMVTQLFLVRIVKNLVYVSVHAGVKTVKKNLVGGFLRIPALVVQMDHLNCCLIRNLSVNVNVLMENFQRWDQMVVGALNVPYVQLVYHRR